MPTSNEWLACVCTEVDDSTLSGSVKFHLKANVQGCVNQHVTCLQDARIDSLKEIKDCATSNAALAGCWVGLGAGAAVGSLILACVTAPVSLPIIFGAAFVVAVCGAAGTGIGDAVDDDQE